MTEPPRLNLGQMAGEIGKLTEQVKHLEKTEGAARRDTTAARARLSDAQKAFDMEIKKLREQSPWSTHWSDSSRRRGTDMEAAT